MRLHIKTLITQKLPKAAESNNWPGMVIAEHTDQVTCGQVAAWQQQAGEHAYRSGVHSCQGCHDGGPSQDQHGADNDVGQEAEEKEDQVGNIAPSGVHNLQHCVGGGRLHFDLHCQDAEENDLNGCSGCVPEGTGNAVLVGLVGTLKQSCCSTDTGRCV